MVILGSGCGYSGVWLWLFWGLVVVILGSGCGYSGVWLWLFWGLVVVILGSGCGYIIFLYHFFRSSPGNASILLGRS